MGFNIRDVHDKAEAMWEGNQIVRRADLPDEFAGSHLATMFAKKAIVGLGNVSGGYVLVGQSPGGNPYTEPVSDEFARGWIYAYAAQKLRTQAEEEGI